MKTIKKIIKWFFILTIGGGIIFFSILMLFGFLIQSYEDWNDREITIIALECLWSVTPSGEENKKEWYLIKQKHDNFKETYIYRGVHMLFEDQLDLERSSYKKDKIFKQSKLYESTSKYHYFGLSKNNFKDKIFGGGDLKKWGHRINRKTLEINYVPNKDSGMTFGTCEEISEKVFYEKIKIAKKNLSNKNRL
jgi:hypothetical protein